MPEDPATIARRRRADVETSLRAAEELEGRSLATPGFDNPDLMLLKEAVLAQWDILCANNHRLKAICEHLGLRVEDDDAP